MIGFLNLELSNKEDYQCIVIIKNDSDVNAAILGNVIILIYIYLKCHNYTSNITKNIIELISIETKLK